MFIGYTYHNIIDYSWLIIDRLSLQMQLLGFLFMSTNKTNQNWLLILVPSGDVYQIWLVLFVWSANWVYQ